MYQTLQSMLTEFNAFLTRWSDLWFFIVLTTGLVIEFHSNYMLRKEYDYDKSKDDEKKRRKTRTTKKTTNRPGGETITEESTEIDEPSQETKQ